MLSDEHDSSVPQEKTKIPRGKATNLRRGRNTAALRIRNVNDYIEPSIGCIKSSPGTTEIQEPLQEADRGLELSERKDVKFSRVTITLDDCLVCSGCIDTVADMF